MRSGLAVLSMVLSIVLLIGASCESGGEASGTESAPTATEDSCSEALAVRLVEQYIEAYNRGETGLADRFFAQGDAFEWYSHQPARVSMQRSEDPTADPYDRNSLDDFLAAQHATGERFTSVKVSDVRLNSASQALSFSLAVQTVSGVARGKGSIDCSTERFVVWSLGESR